MVYLLWAIKEYLVERTLTKIRIERIEFWGVGGQQGVVGIPDRAGK